MAEISYRRHRFPPVIIQHAVWLYLRFTLSYRDVEESRMSGDRDLDLPGDTGLTLTFRLVLLRIIGLLYGGKLSDIVCGCSS